MGVVISGGMRHEDACFVNRCEQGTQTRDKLVSSPFCFIVTPLSGCMTRTSGSSNGQHGWSGAVTGEGSGAGGSGIITGFKGAMEGCSTVLLGAVVLGTVSSVADRGSEAANGCEFGVVSLWSTGLGVAATNADFIVHAADEQLPNAVATNHPTGQQAHQNQTCIEL